MQREILLMPDGRVTVQERDLLPVESTPRPCQAIVRTVAGAISAGTETTQIRQRRNAPPSARYDTAVRLGYSVAGVVEAIGEGYEGPPVGTPVAVYGGPYVCYADRLMVGQNLIAPAATLPVKQAAFGGIGAIALHGVRMGSVELGQRVGILGLGIIGQLTAQLARAAGAWVLACDPLESRRKMVDLGSGSETVSPNEWSEAARRFTDHRGLDCVLVCAGTPEDNAPAVAALEAVRYRGRVIIVGNVQTAWPREMLFQKEATVLVSRAAGPGRYDPAYERDGWDPHPGLTPWTEGRNLRCFIDLLAAGRVKVEPLISDVLPVTQAAEAYERLMNRPQETLAVVLEF